MTKKPKALYICDPILNEECNKHWCHINGGPCYMTENIKYAKVVGGGGMKQSIFDKIRSYLSGQVNR